LGVDPDAPDEVVQAAYRALAAKYHPDKNPSDVDAALKLQRINAAFRVLGDPEKRRQYDDLTRGPDDGGANEPSEAKGSADYGTQSKPTGRKEPKLERDVAPGRKEPEGGPPARSPFTCPHCGARLNNGASRCSVCLKRSDVSEGDHVRRRAPGRLLAAGLAVVLSLYVNLTGPANVLFQVNPGAALVGLLIGCGLLALFVFWLAGKFSPSVCGGGAVLLAASVLVLRDKPAISLIDVLTRGAAASAPTAPTHLTPEARAAQANTTDGVDQPAVPFYDRSGNSLDLTIEEARAGYLAGKCGPLKDAQIPVVTSDGQIGTVDSSDLQALFRAGGRLATKAEVARDARRR
jgi:hypothetical protein